MPLLTVVLTLLVIGVLMWLFETYIPLDPMVKRIIQIVVIIAIVVWLLQISGLLGGLSTVPFPHR
jgi:hypothetical protein